jgi:hypothetical protein
VNLTPIGANYASVMCIIYGKDEGQFHGNWSFSQNEKTTGSDLDINLFIYRKIFCVTDS